MGYLSGQGKVYTALKGADGLPLDFTFRGNIPTFQLAINIDTLEHKESTSGHRLVDLRLITGKKVDLTMNVQEFTPENFALMMQGDIQTTSSGSVSGEVLNGGAALQDGKAYALQNKDVTSLVLTDSAATPASLVSGTNYVPNAGYGMVQALGSQAGFTAPIKAAYTKKSGQRSVGLLSQAEQLLWLRFLAINTAQKTVAGAYKRFVLDLFNVQFDPAAGLGLIQDTLADNELKGSVLVDPTRGDGTPGGQIGLLTWLDE